MNYTTKNEKIKTALEDFFGRLSKNSTINFAVDYSQRRKMSCVIIQVVGSFDYQFLIFFYTKSHSLYDILKYRNRNFVRVGQLARLTPQINLINHFILTRIPNFNPWSSRNIIEDSTNDLEKNSQLYKDKINVLKSKNRTYRDEIKSLRNRLKLKSKNPD